MPPAQRGEAKVGVVVTEQEPVFRAAGEHPVGLIDAAGNQVIDQDAEIRLRRGRATRAAAAWTDRAALIPATRP